MRIIVGVTDNRWASFLRDRDDVTEANFWQPSPHGFKALSPGEPFLFKTKDSKKFKGFDIPGYHLVGGGFFDEYVEMRVSEAWTIWGTANGVDSERELLSRAQGYRARSNSSVDPDPTIGCIILRNIFFADRGSEMLEPPNWARNIVTYAGYDLNSAEPRQDAEYVKDAFAMLQHHARVDYAWEPDLRGVNLDWEGPRYGPPVLVRPRMGQGHFKRAVAAAYGQRCAVTASATFPVLKRHTLGLSQREASMPSPMVCCYVPTFTACTIAGISAWMATSGSGFLLSCASTAGTERSSMSVRRLAT